MLDTPAIRPRVEGEPTQLSVQSCALKQTAVQVVLVQDPEVSSIMQQMGQPAGDNRGREKRFIFDHAFDGTSTNTAVYRGTVQVGL